MQTPFFIYKKTNFFARHYGWNKKKSIIFVGEGSKNRTKGMNKVRITAVRQTEYKDLMAKYENAIEHACDVRIGQEWVSVDGKCPDGFCPSAWDSVRPFVESLACGEGNFFAERKVAPDGTVEYHNGWMKNPMSAMISCNDGFRPVSFYLEVMASW